MFIKSFVSLCYELAIKPLLAAARLVARDQKDRVAFRVERKATRQTPSAASKRNSIRVARTFERIDAGPAELWAKLLQQQGMSA